MESLKEKAKEQKWNKAKNGKRKEKEKGKENKGQKTRKGKKKGSKRKEIMKRNGK